jgi:hypothetical protein
MFYTRPLAFSIGYGSPSNYRLMTFDSPYAIPGSYPLALSLLPVFPHYLAFRFVSIGLCLSAMP